MAPAQSLTLAGVPEALHAEALASIARAKEAKRGLLLHKLKARWLHAGDIAELLDWEDERLCTACPEWASWDIAPMLNVTAHGDNGPWEIDGSRPKANYWLSQDVTSNEYQTAVASNYWCKGTHPRSKKSVKAWYRRNAGEYLAWRLGAAVEPSNGFEIWRGKDGKDSAVVWRCCGAWLVKSSTHIVGSLYLNSRKGYEIDNVFSGDYTAQMWFPIPGYQLRAPVTWSVLPGKAQSMEPKRWEAVRDDGDGKTYTKWIGA